MAKRTAVAPLPHECQWHRLYITARDQHTTLLLERNALRERVEVLERVRQAALEFRNEATDTYFVGCSRGDPEEGRQPEAPCGYHKCDYHNMRAAEEKFDAALASTDPAALAAGGAAG